MEEGNTIGVRPWRRDSSLVTLLQRAAGDDTWAVVGDGPRGMGAAAAHFVNPPISIWFVFPTYTGYHPVLVYRIMSHGAVYRYTRLPSLHLQQLGGGKMPQELGFNCFCFNSCSVEEASAGAGNSTISRVLMHGTSAYIPRIHAYIVVIAVLQ